MPFNPSQGLGKQESKLLRALKALPFLGITATAVYLMVGVGCAQNIVAKHRLTDIRPRFHPCVRALYRFLNME